MTRSTSSCPTRAAIEWIEQFGDADGDGYVEYRRATDRGLANQGWKDSWDGIRYANGKVAEAPIALCEVQAYIYSAYLAQAHFAFEAGDQATYDRFRAKAAHLKTAFNRDFWFEDRGWFAVGLDAEKTAHRLADLQHRSLSVGRHHRRGQGAPGGRSCSCPRHVLRLGGPHALEVDRRLQPDQLPLRIGLAARHRHRGRRPGPLRVRRRRPEAHLRAPRRGQTLGGRLPELFSGLDRGELTVPVGYPTSCSPQAWAAASPMLCLRTLLRLDPWIPYGKMWLCPHLPESIGYLKVEGIPLAGSRVTLEVGSEVPGGVTVEGLPPDIEIIREPRRPSTAV